MSGIISGITIAYLAAKLFNIKQERENRQKEINEISEKLTNFRRLLYYILSDHDYWIEYKGIKQFKQKYGDLNFDRLHLIEPDPVKRRYRDDESIEAGDTSVDLYLSMEAILGEMPSGFTNWVYDKTKRFNYSLGALYDYRMPSNQLWYYLEYKYHKHTDGLINDTHIGVLYKDHLPEAISAIDNKYRGREFNRFLLAEIGTDFHSYYLPKMIELTEQNLARPTVLQAIFRNLSIIFIVGVICPLILQCIDLYYYVEINSVVTLISVGVVILAFVNFLFDFYSMMHKEIDTRPSDQTE